MITPTILPREVTQAKLDRRGAVSMAFRASQTDTTAECIEAGALAFGERPCIFYGDQLWSYKQFNEAVNQVAHAAQT